MPVASAAIHEFLLTQREDLAADDPGDEGPVEDGQDDHHEVDTGLGAYLVGVHDGAEDDEDRPGGDAVEDIDNPHDQHIDPLAEVAGEAAQHDADDRLEDNDNEADHQGDPGRRTSGG